MPAHASTPENLPSKPPDSPHVAHDSQLQTTSHTISIDSCNDWLVDLHLGWSHGPLVHQDLCNFVSQILLQLRQLLQVIPSTEVPPQPVQHRAVHVIIQLKILDKQ